MSTEQNKTYQNFLYPPGGILLWIIILLELITFAGVLVAMAYNASIEPEIFHTSRLQLNVTIGTINTVVLLTSGLFMAAAVHSFKLSDKQKASNYLLFTILLGLTFLVLKSIEYSSKIDAGLTIDTNLFYSYYWMLTVFHVIHVLVGLVILVVIYTKIKKSSKPIALLDLESGAAFWHLCDLIWLLLFPIIYLIF